MSERGHEPSYANEQQLTRIVELSRDYYEAIGQLHQGEEALYLGVNTGGSWITQCVNDPLAFVEAVNRLNGSVEAIMLAVPAEVHAQLACAPFQNAA